MVNNTGLFPSPLDFFTATWIFTKVLVLVLALLHEEVSCCGITGQSHEKLRLYCPCYLTSSRHLRLFLELRAIWMSLQCSTFPLHTLQTLHGPFQIIFIPLSQGPLFHSPFLVAGLTVQLYRGLSNSVILRSWRLRNQLLCDSLLSHLKSLICLMQVEEL